MTAAALVAIANITHGACDVPALTSADRDTFARQGYLHVRGRIPAARIEAMAAVIDRIVDTEARTMRAAGEIGDIAEYQPFERRWYHVWRQYGGKQRFGQVGWHSRVFSRALFDLWVEPAILDAVEALIGAEIQFNGDFWVRPKLPDEQETTLPWHQDSGYMPDTADHPLLTLWMPLVEVNAENGTLQFVPGSHKLGIQDHDTADGAFRTTAFDPAAGAAIDTVAMSPGDFVLFDNLVFHRSTVNRADMVRWSIDFRYSPVGTPMGHLWHADMAFTARSRHHPERTATWKQVGHAWQHSRQRRERAW